jgi:O-acetyl-ADP-ribose deacetylase (regulator of RNase III)
VITGAGLLHAKHVVHAVGPVYRGGGFGEAELLASCHREAFRLADEHGAKLIAFPAISTGAYCYPMKAAAEIAIREVRVALEAGSQIETARFVLFDNIAYETFRRLASIS